MTTSKTLDNQLDHMSTFANFDSSFVAPQPLPSSAQGALSSRREHSLTAKLTIHLVDVYSKVNPEFQLIDKLPQVS
jgi:hypothetical protein